MIDWNERAPEEQALLNPGFCATLIWYAAASHFSHRGNFLSFEESFLILPMALDRKTRELLPDSTRTSLASWLENEPLIRNRIAIKARLLTDFTKDALIFGGVHGLIKINNFEVSSDILWNENVRSTLKSSSNEVREISRKSEFLGKWFSAAGSSATVLTLIGVRA